jgi:putative cell wall-binding protein
LPVSRRRITVAAVLVGLLISTTSPVPPGVVAVASPRAAAPTGDGHDHDHGTADHHRDGHVHGGLETEHDHSVVGLRDATPAEIEAAGLVEGVGRCAGYYEDRAMQAARLATARLGPDTEVVCTHGGDYFDSSAAAVAGGGFVAPELDPDYDAPGIPCYPTGPYVKVFYGYRQGSANRASSLGLNVREIVARVDDIVARSAGQVGGTRHVRWKYVAGSPDCDLSITAVALPASVFDAISPTTTRFNLMSRGLLSSSEKGLIFTDEPGSSCAGIAGIAELIPNQSPSPSNPNNNGAMMARVFGPCWNGPEDLALGGEVAAHELVHTLGAVQNGAPNSSYRTGGQGHCTDGHDIMCYDDGGGAPKIVCALTYPTLLDCNKNDYFHPSPSAGNYLATHWNTASNRFLSTAAPPQRDSLLRPTVALTAPSSGASVAGNVTITATAAAASDGHAIQQVEFWIDGKGAAVDTTAPYSVSISTLPETDGQGGWANGTTPHILAIAVDVRGRTKASAPRSMTIANPRTRLTAPAPRAVVPEGGTPWSATASAGPGRSVTKVELLVDDTVVATDTTSPYGGTWNATEGAYLLAARVTDSGGAVATTGERDVLVISDPVEVRSIAPSVGDTAVVGRQVRMAAEARSRVGRSITKVEFLADGVVVATDTAAPYLTTWIPGAADPSVQIDVRATDSAGASATVDGAFLSVIGSAGATVTLADPDNGATVTGTVPLAATVATTGDWTVDGVAFYAGGVIVGNDDSAPYTATWDTAGRAGPVEVIAVASITDETTFDFQTVPSIGAVVTVHRVVAVGSPAAGAFLAGTVNVVASVAPAGWASFVEMTAGAAEIAFLDPPGYASTWDTRFEEDGPASVVARAISDEGDEVVSAPVAVTVRNSRTTISVPASGATIAAPVTLTATALSDVASYVEQVRFLIDGVDIGGDDDGHDGAPYRVTWDPAAATTGSHTLVARAILGDGRTVDSAGRSFIVSKPAVTRLAGPDRYATAVAISQASFAPNVPVAFIATGSSFPDALAGAAVAGRDGGPVLLVTRDAIPTAVKAELTRLKPKKIVVLGGTGVVSSAVQVALDPYTTGPVSRLAGNDRYATAVAISKASFAAGIETVFVATGRSFPDALAGAAVAGALGSPILLVTATSLPSVVRTELARLNPQEIVILGGTGAVSNAVAQAMTDYGTVYRVSGADRYATAAQLSAAAYPSGAPSAYVATGLAFPDALAGAAVAGWVGAPILLVAPTFVPASVSAEVQRLGPGKVVILGGTGAVSESVRSTLLSLIT